MSLYYGSWDRRNGNGMRVAIRVTTSRVTHSSNSVTFTVKFYTENQWRYNDRQYLHFTGDLSNKATYEYWNSTGGNSYGGGLIHRATRTYTYNYPSGSYGSSPGRVTFGGWIGETYNGSKPSVSERVSIPARPYASPARPSNVVLERPYTSRLTVSWNTNATNGEPYTSQQLRIRKYTGSSWGSWRDLATVSGRATSYVINNGVDSNTLFQIAIRSRNSAGRSDWRFSNIVGNYPEAPYNVRAGLSSNGSSVVVRWQTDAYDPPASEGEVSYHIQRRPGSSGSWTTVATGVQGTSWSDTNPEPGENQYRIESVSSVDPGTHSSFTESNVVSTIVPPLSPTRLDPNGDFVDLNDDLTLTWQHNDGGDGADQSQFQVEYSDDSGETWTSLSGTVSSGESSYTITGGTLPNSSTAYQWRVRTRGVTTESFGPWSDVATFTGVTSPVVTITSPGPEVTSPPLRVAWDYSQAEGFPLAASLVTLYDENNVVLEQKIVPGTTYTFDHRIEDAATYTIEVRSQPSNTGAGVYGIDSVTTTVKFPVPAAIDSDVLFGECDGTAVISLRSASEEPTVPAVTNLATNPSVEVGLKDWGAGFSTNVITRDPTRSYSGTASATTVWTADGGRVHHTVRGLTDGATYSASAWVYVPTGAPPVTLTSYLDTAGTTSTKINEWEQLTVTWSAKGTDDAVGIEPAVSSTDREGHAAWIDALMVVEGPNPHLDYFDGSTPNLPNRSYTWQGTPHDSRSDADPRVETEPVAAIVERRIGGGEWVTLATNLPIPASLTDPLPNMHGETEYRITSVSSIPSYRKNDPVVVEGPDGGWKKTAGYWGFLSWGDGFARTLRTQDDLELKQEASRSRSVQPFLGRTKPLAMAGANTERVVTVSAGLFYDEECPADEMCEYSSPPSEWEEAGLESTIVCWRDYTGRRLFGVLSKVETQDGPIIGAGSVTFSVTEADYTEVYEQETI